MMVSGGVLGDVTLGHGVAERLNESAGSRSGAKRCCADGVA